MGGERMKVMIAYDESGYTDVAINDLPRAGLPPESEVLIVSVVDPSVSRPPVSEFDLISAATRRVDAVLAQVKQHETQAFKDARTTISKAARRLRRRFPEWEIGFDVLLGTPVDQLLEKAASWEPDLIIEGSHGRSTIGRFFLGSVSQPVAEQATCSVRIVREPAERTDGEPLELILGVTNPADTKRLVDAVSNRVWNADTRIRLIVVDNGVTVNSVLGMDGKSIYEDAAEPLFELGIPVSIQIETGDPKSIWLQAAESSRADAIFVAGNGRDEPGLGGPALELITGARCTVEIVR